MFDSKAELGIRLLDRRVSVSMPSDTEWIEWRRKKKIQQKDLGRRSFQMESSKPEQADTDLFNKINRGAAIEGAAPVDEAEAFYVINKLAECEVREQPERDGSQFVIQMRVLGKLDTTHVLRVPSMKEMMDYERTRSSVTFGQYGTQEIRINYRAAADLYEKLKVRADGYVNDIPVPHKAEAINVLLQEIRAEQDEETADPE